MTIKEIQTSPELRTEYIKWREQPMTRMVVDIVRLEGRIFMPRPEYIKSEIALAAMGENAGYHNALDRVMNLDKTEVKPEGEIPATYGGEEIMAELYPERIPKTKGNTDEE